MEQLALESLRAALLSSRLLWERRWSCFARPTLGSEPQCKSQHQHGYFLLLFSCLVMSHSLRPHGLQHARLPCPSLSPGASSNSSSRWCHPTISSSISPFSSCPQSFPESGCMIFMIILRICLKWSSRTRRGRRSSPIGQQVSQDHRPPAPAPTPYMAAFSTMTMIFSHQLWAQRPPLLPPKWRRGI